MLGSRFVESDDSRIGIRPLAAPVQSTTTGQLILEKLAIMVKKIEKLEKTQTFESEEEFSFEKLTKERELDFVDEALMKKDRDTKLEIVNNLLFYPSFIKNISSLFLVAKSYHNARPLSKR